MSEMILAERQMTEAEAIELAKSEWWRTIPLESIAWFQLFQEMLCMNFGDFHEAVQRTLGRPVFTHEFASSFIRHLQGELVGTHEPRTMQDIIELIPEEKRLIVSLDCEAVHESN